MWIPIVAILAQTPALAGSKDQARQAESVRLHEEMQRLAQRTAWSGVERQYQKLTDIRGIEVPANAHMLGARAAQATGNISAARKRAELAIETAGTDVATLTAASEFLTEFDILNGPVRVDVPSQLETPPAIRSASPAFDPVLRSALEHANQALVEKRSFDGYLPLGQYLAGNTAFDVLPSEKPIRVIATPAVDVAPAPAPAPVAAGPEAKMVFLAVRGDGWLAESWPTLLPHALDAVRDVDGVMLVDAFAPDGDWLVVQAENEALKAAKIPSEDVVAVLTEPWIDASTETTLVYALPPGSGVDLAELGQRVLGEETLGSYTTVEAVPTGAFPVPADASPMALYRIEVKFAGEDPLALERALQTIEGLEALGFKVEEPPAR